MKDVLNNEKDQGEFQKFLQEKAEYLGPKNLNLECWAQMDHMLTSETNQHQLWNSLLKFWGEQLSKIPSLAFPSIKCVDESDLIRMIGEMKRAVKDSLRGPIDLYELAEKVGFAFLSGDIEKDNDQLKSGGIQGIVKHLITHLKDDNIIDEMLCCFRNYIPAEFLFRILSNLFKEAEESSNKKECDPAIIRENVCKVMKRWLILCSKWDIVGNKWLQAEFMRFLIDNDELIAHDNKSFIKNAIIMAGHFESATMLPSPKKKSSDNIHKKSSSSIKKSYRWTQEIEGPFHVCKGKWTEKQIAEHLTIIDAQLFQKIHPTEFRDKRWQKDNKAELAPNVVEMTNRFNEVSFWVATQVVEAEKMGKTASATITFFIKVVKHLHELRNFNGMASVVSGLNNNSVQQKKQSWAKVKEVDMKDFEHLEKLVGVQENYKIYRELIREQTEACIPFIAVHLRDIFFAIDSNDQYCLFDNKDYKDLFISFSTLKAIGECILGVMRFQRLEYDLECEEGILDVLTHLKILNQQQLHEYASHLPQKKKRKSNSLTLKKNDMLFSSDKTGGSLANSSDPLDSDTANSAPPSPRGKSSPEVMLEESDFEEDYQFSHQQQQETKLYVLCHCTFFSPKIIELEDQDFTWGDFRNKVFSGFHLKKSNKVEFYDSENGKKIDTKQQLLDQLLPSSNLIRVNLNFLQFSTKKGNSGKPSIALRKGSKSEGNNEDKCYVALHPNIFPSRVVEFGEGLVDWEVLIEKVSKEYKLNKSFRLKFFDAKSGGRITSRNEFEALYDTANIAQLIVEVTKVRGSTIRNEKTKINTENYRREIVVQVNYNGQVHMIKVDPNTDMNNLTEIVMLKLKKQLSKDSQESQPVLIHKQQQIQSNPKLYDMVSQINEVTLKLNTN